MTSSTLVSDELAKKFATEKGTPYERWVQAEGLDIIGGHYVPNLRTVDLKPWARRGGKGVFINHEASRTSNDCYVCEIPPGGKLEPQRQLFEEMVLVLEGRGSTSVWNDKGQKLTFEWKAGAIFASPLNAYHQHFNGSGAAPARYVGVTFGPQLLNMFDDVDFVFNTPRDFPARFSGEPDYFSNKGEQDGFLLRTNFVPDAVNLPLISAKERGAGGGADGAGACERILEQDLEGCAGCGEAAAGERGERDAGQPKRSEDEAGAIALERGTGPRRDGNEAGAAEAEEEERAAGHRSPAK